MTSIKYSEATHADVDYAAANLLDIFDDSPGAVESTHDCVDGGLMYTMTGPDGSIGGVIGGHAIWPGVLRVGSLLTTNIYKYPISYMRSMNHFIGYMMIQLDLHRTEFAITADHAAGHRWAKALGFQPEGRMRQYRSNKQDSVMYGRIR